MEPLSIVVAGSKGDYVVTRSAAGNWHCSCPAFARRPTQLCKHISSMHTPRAEAA